MALLYQPPKLPYAGTELGSGSNVYCKDLQGSLLNIGPGFTSSSDFYLGQIKANWTSGSFAAGQTYTTTGVVSGTSTVGSGLTAKFSVTVPNPNTKNDGDPLQVSLIVVDPGYGYKPGPDTRIFFDADAVLAAFNAGTTPAVADAVYTMEAGEEFILQGGTSVSAISIVAYAENAEETGWQFQLLGPNDATSQLITIVIPNASQNDFDSNKYAIVANATGGRNGDKETFTKTVGVVSGSITRDDSANTVTITVRRAAGDSTTPDPGDNVLLPCSVTVRLAKRELAFS